MTPERRAAMVKRRALSLDFDSVGITHLHPPPHGTALRRWLDKGMAGTMRYMHRQAARRLEPERILPEARRAIVLTRSYHHREPAAAPGSGRVAKYARGRDYHEVLEAPLRELASYITSLGRPDAIAKWYVDHGPVPERELAQRAGLGWIGKNTMLIDPRRGSYFVLATVVTNLELALDLPFEEDRCGTCTRCLDACPTHAFPSERVLDSRRCISYLTIEHRGEIDTALQSDMGDWIFGCDICQDVCPWNHKFAAADQQHALPHDPSLAALDLRQLGQVSDEEFERLYGWTPLERPGAAGMRRNARIALRNACAGTAGTTCPTP